MIGRAEAALMEELQRQADDGRCSIADDAITLSAVDLVRAILIVMREPTERMQEAISDVPPGRPHGDYWRAGIDAALAGAG